MNSVILTGFVAQDTKTAVTESGKKYTRIRLGVPKRDAVQFFDIIAWESKSDFAEKYLTKGKGIGITGRLEPYSYEKEGKTISGISIVAEEFEFTTKHMEEE